MPRSLKIHRELETSLRELFFEWSVPDAATMSPPPLQREAFEDRVFLFLVLGVSLAFVWILRPYAGAILWGTVLAIVFAPLNRHLRDRLRQRRTIAAAVTLLVIVILVLFPVALIVSSLIDEGTALYQRIQSGELDVSTWFQQVYAALPDAQNIIDAAVQLLQEYA